MHDTHHDTELMVTRRRGRKFHVVLQNITRCQKRVLWPVQNRNHTAYIKLQKFMESTIGLDPWTARSHPAHTVIQ